MYTEACTEDLKLLSWELKDHDSPLSIPMYCTFQGVLSVVYLAAFGGRRSMHVYHLLDHFIDIGDADTI